MKPEMGSAFESVSRAVAQVSKEQGATEYAGKTDFSDKDIGSDTVARMFDPDPEYPIDKDGKQMKRHEVEGYGMSLYDRDDREFYRDSYKGRYL